jgi:hypothetical protein
MSTNSEYSEEITFYNLLASQQIHEKSIPQSLKESVQTILDVSCIQSYYPGIELIFNQDCIKKPTTNYKNISINGGKIVAIENTEQPKKYTVELADNSKEVVFCKKVHILDPYEKIMGNYNIDPTKYKNITLPCSNNYYNLYDTLTSQTNQAYIDALVGSILSYLTVHNYSPHFVKQHDVYMGVANTYKYDITQDFDSLKYHSWFWDIINSGNELYVTDLSNNIIPISEIPQEIIGQPENDELYSYSSDSDTISIEELSPIESSNAVSMSDDLEECSSIKTDIDYDTINVHNESKYNEDNIKINIDISEMPVMLIFQECMSGTMDELLNDDEYTTKNGNLNGKQEAIWSAWIFQVVIALTQMQALFGIVHNDLHTNNVMWINTDRKYLYYKNRSGQKYKVPTYGKIFKIIDFGRATFNWDNNTIFSDDYRDGNDAYGQYNIDDDSCDGPCEPNPSFDLCRFAVSLIEGLYNSAPSEKKKGEVLSVNGKKTVKETISPLYNLLWSWMVDDNEESIYLDENDEHRFPGFELYVHIASYIHGAVPSKQINTSVFNNYKYTANIPNNEMVYSLFV